MHKYYLDKPTIISLISRILVLVSTLLMMVTAWNYLTPNTLGYFYTFISFQGLIVFIELGLYGAIVNNISILSKKKNNTNNSDFSDYDLGSISTIFRYALKWFCFSTTLLFFALIFIGKILFTKTLFASYPIEYQWIIYIFFLCVNFNLIPFLAILEGCNDREFVYLTKIKATIFSVSLTCLSIIFEFEIWAPAILLASNFISIFIQIVYRYGKFFIKINNTKCSNNLFINSLYSQHWRFAVSSICGYFSNSFIVPSVMFFQGPIWAGKIGVTLAFLSGLASISTSIISPQSVEIAKLAFNNDVNKIDIIINKYIKIILFINLLAILIILLFYYYFLLINHPFIDKLLEIDFFVLFLFSSAISVSVFPYAFAMRSFRVEPLLLYSVITALLLLMCNLIANIFYNINAFISSYCFITVVMALFMPCIWVKFKNQLK
jgi:O-antigen/teichoic acid export membrane protein